MKIALFCGAVVGLQALNYLRIFHEEIIVVTNTPEIIEYCSQNNIKIYKKDNIPEVDALFSVYYNELIPKESFFNVPFRINFHGGKLPEYSGCYSNIWAIINREKSNFATAHILEANFDTGDIVDEIEVPIEDDDTGEDVYWKTSTAIFELFVRVYTSISEETGLIRRKQDLSKRKYYKRELPNNGFVDLVDNNAYNFIRAVTFKGFESAHTRLNGKKIYLRVEK